MRRTLPLLVITAVASLFIAVFAPFSAQAASVTATFAKASTWGGGFEGRHTITKAKGLNVLVNPMLMDFGYSGNWGDAIISAANATLGQMKAIWPSKTDAQLKKLLGLTPMIGKNDTGQTTTQADARKLLSYAQTNHVGRIGFWSAGRDNGGCPNGQVSPTCSGISQSPYEFSTIFKGFNG